MSAPRFQLFNQRTTYYRYGGKGIWAQVPNEGEGDDIVIENLRDGEMLTVNPTIDAQLGDDITQFTKREYALVQAREKLLSATLPLDPEGLNDNRAHWAGVALSAFRSETGSDWEDALADLLGDLMHWADRNNMSFDGELLRARRYYAEETTEVK